MPASQIIWCELLKALYGLPINILTQLEWLPNAAGTHAAS